MTESLSADSLRRLGKGLVQKEGCLTCHSLDGSERPGPTFQGLYGTTDREMRSGTTLVVDDEYLRESIVNSSAKIVAGFSNLHRDYSYLTDTEVTALIELIKSLSDKKPPNSE